MRLLRVAAVILALSLMGGEAYRSWGAGRHVAFWVDDMLMGSLLIASAVAVRRETTRRRAWFSGAWGVSLGMLYGSFFSKLYPPPCVEAGNIPIAPLTTLVGVAFATAIVGFVASLVLGHSPNLTTSQRTSDH